MKMGDEAGEYGGNAGRRDCHVLIPSEIYNRTAIRPEECGRNVTENNSKVSSRQSREVSVPLAISALSHNDPAPVMAFSVL